MRDRAPPNFPAPPRLRTCSFLKTPKAESEPFKYCIECCIHHAYAICPPPGREAPPPPGPPVAALTEWRPPPVPWHPPRGGSIYKIDVGPPAALTGQELWERHSSARAHHLSTQHHQPGQANLEEPGRCVRPDERATRRMRSNKPRCGICVAP